MHDLLKAVQKAIAEQNLTHCPVCTLPLAQCQCDTQITDKVLTLIELENFTYPQELPDWAKP